MASTADQEARTRPGGRTARVTRKIHAAVLDLLTTRGHEACTFQNVAALAGVERSTLYRRYPDRWLMMIEAYASWAEEEVAVEPTGNFAEDFRLLIRRFSQLWSTKLAEAMLAMVLAVRGTAAQDRVGVFLDRRYRAFDPMFDAAVARGEIPASTNRQEVLERAAGTAIFHLLIANENADDEWIDKLVADFVKIYACRKETPS